MILCSLVEFLAQHPTKACHHISFLNQFLTSVSPCRFTLKYWVETIFRLAHYINKVVQLRQFMVLTQRNWPTMYASKLWENQWLSKCTSCENGENDLYLSFYSSNALLSLLPVFTSIIFTMQPEVGFLSALVLHPQSLVLYWNPTTCLRICLFTFDIFVILCFNKRDMGGHVFVFFPLTCNSIIFSLQNL